MTQSRGLWSNQRALRWRGRTQGLERAGTLPLQCSIFVVDFCCLFFFLRNTWKEARRRHVAIDARIRMHGVFFTCYLLMSGLEERKTYRKRYIAASLYIIVPHPSSIEWRAHLHDQSRMHMKQSSKQETTNAYFSRDRTSRHHSINSTHCCNNHFPSMTLNFFYQDKQKKTKHYKIKEQRINSHSLINHFQTFSPTFFATPKRSRAR